MLKIKKIKSFTLSEMLVVMILTAIVVGLAFSVLRLVQNHMTSIQANVNGRVKLTQFQQALEIDFNRYNTAFYDSEEDKLTLFTAIDSTTYIFNENKIIRKADTFPVTIHEKMFYFDAEPVINGKIDALKLRVGDKKKQQFIFVYKENDATPYMN